MLAEVGMTMQRTSIKRVITILLVLLSTNTIIQGDLIAADTTLVDIIDGLQMRSHYLDSMEARLKGVFYNIDSLECLYDANARTILVRQNVEVCSKGDKLKVANEGLDKNDPDKGPDRINIVAWDGEKTRAYTNDWFKEPKTSGIIKGHRSDKLSISHYLSALECDTLELQGRLESHIDPSTWTIIGPEKVGSYSTVHIAGPVKARKGAYLHAWIDPTHDFAPVGLMMERHRNGKDFIQKMMDVKLKKIDGVWARTACKTLVSNPSVRPGWCVYDYEVEEIHFGLDIPDDTFVLKFPPGIIVFDKTTMVTSLVQDDGTFRAVYYRTPDDSFLVENPAFKFPDESLDMNGSSTGEQTEVNDQRSEISENLGQHVSEQVVKANTHSEQLCNESHWRAYVISVVAIMGLVIGVWCFYKKRSEQP